MSTDSQHQSQVPVDNRSLCRLDYRVAETTVFYVKRIRTGGSFPPNVCSRQQSAGISTSSTDWAWSELESSMWWFSDFRHKRVNSVVHMVAEMNQ